jgi:UTP--glucose-1-phosphate uridylyltransferase
MALRKAVIPAAGLGTRFLPASKSLPKEMIPVIDRPGIQYVVEEAVRAGMEDLLIVTSRGKSAMEDHFDRSPDLEQNLEHSGKHDELQEVRRVAALANIHYVRQKDQLGFGHAVLMGRQHVGDEPFAVLVGDEIVPEPTGGESGLLESLAAVYDEHGSSVVAVVEVPPEEISAYGAIAFEPVGEKVVRVTDMIEKPAPPDAPSNLASRGRYLFTPDIFSALDRIGPGVGGEIQLSDAIKLLSGEQPVYAYVYDGPIFDMGKPLPYLQATVELALRRDDLAKPFLDFLSQVVGRSG